MKKYCTKCGREFEAIGREVICPSCKESARLEAKRAAVMRAKKASWNGESVPVRISGRASTVIRHYGAENDMPFAVALDELLKLTDYFKSVGKAWEDITPYRSHRRDKSTAENTSKPQDVQVAKAAAKATVKAVKKVASTSTSSSKTASKTASKK